MIFKVWDSRKKGYTYIKIALVNVLPLLRQIINVCVAAAAGAFLMFHEHYVKSEHRADCLPPSTCTQQSGPTRCMEQQENSSSATSWGHSSPPARL